MPMFWLLRFAFVAIVSLLVWTGTAQADPTLPDAVKKAGGDPDKVQADLQAAIKKFGAGLPGAAM